MQSFAKCVALAFALCAALSLSPYAATAKSIRVAGQVVDYRAQPVKGAHIVAYREVDNDLGDQSAFAKIAEAESSSDGRFGMPGEGEECWLVAYKAGLALTWKLAYLPCDTVLRLDRPRQLDGMVLDEIGRPVAGARVGLCLKNETMAPRELTLPDHEAWHTRTDSRGRFLFDRIPPETTADFRVDAPGRAPVWTFCDFGLQEGEQFAAGRKDIRITLPADTRLEGRVVAPESGEPVAGVRVQARPYARPGERYCRDPVVTDPNGRFVFTGLRPGVYLLQTLAQERQSHGRFGNNPVVTVEPGQTLRGVELRAGKEAVLELLVRDEVNDKHLEGARITASCAPFRCATTTDANGLARFHVPAGKCTIWGFKRDYGGLISPRDFDLEEGQTCRGEIPFVYAAVSVSGTVSDAQGRALAGAFVASWPFGEPTVADADGRFAIRIYCYPLPATTRLWARHPELGLGNLVELQDPSKSGQFHASVLLEPAHCLTGRVIDPGAGAIPAACVRLLKARPGRRYDEPLAEVLADANGVYCFRGVPVPPPDFEYALVAQAPGYNENSVDGLSLAKPAGEPVHLSPIVLQPARDLVAGIVTDTNDRPVPGASVETPRSGENENQTQPRRKVLTDAQGRFRIENLCQGPVEIVAQIRPPNAREGITYTRGGETNIKVVLGQTLSFARSLTGARLPSLAGFDLREPLPGLEGKAVLLCFLDVQQRPCRHVLRQLAERARELTKSNIALVAVQAAPCAAGEPDKLAGQYGADIRFGKVTDNAEDTQRAWGIQSLPWLVLADRDHIVRAEGFAPAALQQKVDELAGRPVPR
jgi:protocatechuate 3,4-dioxygenase beta subunit